MFCTALRGHPIPISSGAAATQLRGCREELTQELDSYFSSVAREEGAVDVVARCTCFPAIHNAIKATDTAWLSRSPFRCFKICRIEGHGVVLPQSEYLPTASGCGHRPFGETIYRPHVSLYQTGKEVEVAREDTLGTPTEAHFWDEKLSMKGLREHCVSLGLLTVGTKKDLVARLRQYKAKSNNERTAGYGTSFSKQFTLTSAEALEHCRRLRTPFRSPSSSHLSPTPPPSRTSSILCNPQQFVARAVQKRRQEGRVDEELRVHQEELAISECGSPGKTVRDRLSWLLLVDNRERVHGTHRRMQEMLREAGIATESCTLPCGDFMIGIDSAGDRHFAKSAENASTCASSDIPQEGANDVIASIPRCISFVVVERKTVKDLCASITAPRYYEQRRLLAASPFLSVVWIIEGSTEQLRSDERRRVFSACSSLVTVPRFRVVRTRNFAETVLFLHSLGCATASVVANSYKDGIKKPSLVADATACIRTHGENTLLHASSYNVSTYVDVHSRVFINTSSATQAKVWLATSFVATS
ncbi:putative DNA repair protein [Trypanosoma vivax]|nr:putative DNA repair protein [Trypanosoma vivax]